MSDLFDLPFEEEQPTVDSRPSAVTPQSPANPQSTVGPRSPAERSIGASHPSIPGGGIPPTAGLPTDDQRAKSRVLSVTELNVRIRDLLEAELFEVWVEGELSNCRVWNTGHLYFTLKDPGSQMRGVVFRSALRYLKFKPVDGLRVVARGQVSVYEPKGEYQLVCDHMEPQGLGALQLAFDQLKKRLQADGLFDVARKRPLPALPRKIGIVTSLEGAAIRDIINVRRRRYANAHLVICPARVQGDGAAGEIARGIRAVARLRGVDVIIVGRGGGSMEDLWAFNEEAVARAIAASPVPVISAVGHETDVTIADFVADVRAPTPSAAAELVVARKDEFCARIDGLTDRLKAAAQGRIHALSRAVHVLGGRPALAGVPGRVAMRSRHVAELSHALSRSARGAIAVRDRRVQHLRRLLETFDLGRRLGAIAARLATADGRLKAAATRTHHRADGRFRSCANRLDTLSPLAVLGRGYAVCWTADRGRIIRATAEVSVGDSVRVTLAEGELDCEVRSAVESPPGTARTESPRR
jgi:exodeoxyribonuclease VII large subunit